MRGSDCVTRRQKNSPDGEPGWRKGYAMNTLTQKQELEKLLSSADNVVIRRDRYQRSRNSDAAPREFGRLNASIDELAKTAEKCRKQAGE